MGNYENIVNAAFANIRRLSVYLLFASACVTLSPKVAYASGTIAGTDISNRAIASFEAADGLIITIPSNTVTITVDELLDVSVTSSNPNDVIVSPGANDQVLTFQVTNTGNGQETFHLTTNTALGGDDFDPILQQIVIDSNDNNLYDPGVDSIYVAGSNDPDIAPDESVSIFVITSIPADRVDTDRAEVSLLAEANTGTGIPGTSFDGMGQGGGDAVVGATGASDNDNSFLAVQQALVTLVKSATITDPFGGDQAVPGSTITYNLVAIVSGSGVLNNVTISDPIPISTSYIPASITLETTALTDDTDDDAGEFDGSNISVSLGNVAAGETRAVTFEVTIE